MNKMKMLDHPLWLKFIKFCKCFMLQYKNHDNHKIGKHICGSEGTSITYKRLT